jgi:YidC/Oxa1 family membrane protein insertase
MSSCCAICTFQWLAIGLLEFLAFLENYVVFDWAVAIIILVLVVRTLLHPLTKKSQVSMQRFGKAMGDLKPEIDKLQKKYGHDPKRMQQEQMRLMRERGVHFGQMLGCLPMFLQMPIWIALYAMLYFTFDLRQVPAFYGLFQVFWDWPFLADLSAADHFFGEFDQPFRFLMWNVTGINVLPILMGAIFFVQQKYMSPPPSPTMTKEQLQQQKMMKVMMVVMFPLMLYSAPSGLTLYILTSSTIGIFESRYIRRHIKEMDLNPPKKKPKRKSKIKDAQGRAYAAAMKRMEEKRRRKQMGPEKRYKKRK